MNIVLGGLIGATIGSGTCAYFAGAAYYGDPDAIKVGAGCGGLSGYLVGTLIALGLSALR